MPTHAAILPSMFGCEDRILAGHSIIPHLPRDKPETARGKEKPGKSGPFADLLAVPIDR